MFNNATVVYQEVMQKKWIPQRIKVPAFKQSYHTGQNKKKKMKNFMVQPPFQ